MAVAIKEKPILFDPSLRWLKVAASRIGVSAFDYASELNAGRKICGGCGKSLLRTPEHFGFDGKTFDRMRSRCRDCVRVKKREHYRANREQARARQLRYQQENRKRLYDYNARWQRERNKNLRREMITAFGGCCACCGEAESLFLELDHIHNDGAAHRREFGNQLQIIIWLKANGWPRDRFQLLCANCNQGKNRNGGVCPHKKKSTSVQF